MKCNPLRAAFAGLTLLSSVPALAFVGPQDYVRHGLVALYDGVYNSKDASGAPTHAAAPTVWANLVTGTGDLALPSGSFTVGADAITLSAVATATGCSAATSTGTITLEASGFAATSSWPSGNQQAYLNLVRHAQLGYHQTRGTFSAIAGSSSWSSANWKFYDTTEATVFSTYATVDRTTSYRAPLGSAGSVFTNGVAITRNSYWDKSAVGGVPTGELRVGSSTLPCTLHCVRIYDSSLTDDERILNAAIDAVRFRGADPATVTLPSGYSFDSETNLVSTAWADQHRVTESGTATFAAPYDEKKTYKLVNGALGTVTFDESAETKDADHAIAFTGFDAASSATTLFKGGWWDFGAGAFFSSTAAEINRTTVFEDAIVTNVGAVHVAGSGGADNRLELRNGARLYPASVTLGWKYGANQRSKVTVAGGSTLQIAGALKLSDCTSKSEKIYLTGNEVVVSNADSHLVVKGSTCLSQTASSGSGGAPGGNRLVVTDNAVADLAGITISSENSFQVTNRITVSKGGRLTSTSIYCATSPSWNPLFDKCGNVLEILDGGVWTNKGTIQIGQYQYTHHYDNTLFISNGTFHTKTIGSGGTGNDQPWFNAPRQKIIISGPKAKFTVESNSGSGFRLFQSSGVAVDCELAVENGADWTLPVEQRFTYMGGVKRNALVARTRGIFRSPYGFRTGALDTKSTLLSSDCELRAESDGVFVLPWFQALGNRGRLVVDDGRVTCSGAITIGNHRSSSDDWGESGTNCVLRLKGDHPAVTAATVSFVNQECANLEIYLPAEGYLGTHACSTQALVMASTSITLANDTTLSLSGAAALADHQADVRETAKYVLLSAPTLTIPAAVLTAAQAKLPKRCTLKRRQVTVAGKTRNELILRVASDGTAVYLR